LLLTVVAQQPGPDDDLMSFVTVSFLLFKVIPLPMKKKSHA
jgi:hypothetical protein